MPGKDLVTESCVRRMSAGSVLRLSADKIATPAALDLAFEKGIQVLYGEDPEPLRQASDLWLRMLANDGTYVVVVEGGRANVTRLNASGAPQPFGEE